MGPMGDPWEEARRAAERAFAYPWVGRDFVEALRKAGVSEPLGWSVSQGKLEFEWWTWHLALTLWFEDRYRVCLFDRDAHGAMANSQGTVVPFHDLRAYVETLVGAYGRLARSRYDRIS